MGLKLEGVLSKNIGSKLLKEAIECGYFKDIAISVTFIHLGKGNVQNGVGVY